MDEGHMSCAHGELGEANRDMDVTHRDMDEATMDKEPMDEASLTVNEARVGEGIETFKQGQRQGAQGPESIPKKKRRVQRSWQHS